MENDSTSPFSGLSQLKVERLFDRFDYDISFEQGDYLTIFNLPQRLRKNYDTEHHT